MMRLFVAVGAIALVSAPVQAQRAYQTFDYPQAVSSGSDTFLTGIRGTNIVGVWREPSGVTHGLYYDGSTWQIPPNDYLDFPGATSTALYGPSSGTLASGVVIVGSYKVTDSNVDHGCFFDSSQPTGSQWTNIDVPNSTNTIAHSTFGDRIVGNYNIVSGDGLRGPSAGGHAFIYEISTGEWTTFDFPGRGVISTTAYGIYENTIAGGYTDLQGTHGYIHELDTNVWRTYDHPGNAIITHFDGITANAGGGFNLTGDWLGTSNRRGLRAKAFCLTVNGANQTWTDLSFPESTITSGNSVFENTVIGVYSDGDGIIHGFVSTLAPEPPPLSVDNLLQGLIGQLPRWAHDVFLKIRD